LQSILRKIYKKRREKKNWNDNYSGGDVGHR
jgi:hypothetical protein